jgi:hypothetical protein
VALGLAAERIPTRVDMARLVMLIGIAPVRAAEFVVIRLTIIAKT